MASPFEVLLGPFLLLACISILLFGVLVAQIYAYWFSSKDHRALKTLVLVMLTLETFHTALLLHVVYVYFVHDPTQAAYIIWTFQASTYVKITVVALAQGFSTYRIWQLSGKNNMIALIPAILLVTCSALGYSANGLAGKAYSWAAFGAEHKAQVVLNTCLALYIVLDTLLASLLGFYLHRRRSDFNFRRTRNVLQQVTIYGVGTGSVTATGEVVTLITFNLCTNSLVYPGMLLVIGKVYANAMMVMLNMRRHMKNEISSQDGVISIPLGLQRSGGTYSGQTENSHGHVGVDSSKEVTHTMSSASGAPLKETEVFISKDRTVF